MLNYLETESRNRSSVFGSISKKTGSMDNEWEDIITILEATEMYLDEEYLDFKDSQEV